MPLDLTYFNLLETQTQDNLCYEGYKVANGNALILFSKLDNLPIASLQFLSQNTNKIRGKTVIFERNSEDDLQRFQGLMNRDNQDFELVISNLNDNADEWINFNILRTDEKVLEVNPGGLNEINELKPNQSYAIQSTICH